MQLPMRDPGTSKKKFALAKQLSNTIGSSIGCLVLTSCAYLDPYVFPEPSLLCDPTTHTESERQASGCTYLPATAAAITNVYKNGDRVKNRVNGPFGTTSVSRGLGLATFGLATGLAAKTIHGVSGSAPKNLALGAGTTYASSIYFSPPATESLYMVTHAELVCIGMKGEHLISRYKEAQDLVGAAHDKVAASHVSECKDGGPVLDAEQQANTVLNRAKSLDSAVAQALTNASNDVLVEMNRQLLANSPSIESIIKAGTVVVNYASGLLNSPPHIETTPSRLCTATPEQLKELKSQFEGAQNAIVEELNRMGAITDGCTKTAAVPILALAVDQSQVTLEPNQTFGLKVTGGRPPYHSDWQGPVPGTDATKQDLENGARIELHEASGAKDARFKLVVTDSSVVRNSISVDVHLTEAKAPTPKPPAADVLKAERRGMPKKSKKVPTTTLPST